MAARRDTDEILKQLTEHAQELDDNVMGVKRSTRASKRFMVEYLDNTRTEHFGSADGQTFIDHGDEKKRAAWRARHSKIMSKLGVPAYRIKGSPSYWSWNLLW
jgi:hypothetical protein